VSTIARPRVARIHYREATNDIHVTATGIDTNGLLNKTFKAIADLATLAEVFAFILSEFAPILPDGTVGSTIQVGNLVALADNIKATYPTGFIPSAPLT